MVSNGNPLEQTISFRPNWQHADTPRLVPWLFRQAQFRRRSPNGEQLAFVDGPLNPTTLPHPSHPNTMLSRSAVQALRVSRTTVGSTSRPMLASALPARTRSYATEVSNGSWSPEEELLFGGPPPPKTNTDAIMKRYTGKGFPRIPVGICGGLSPASPSRQKHTHS